MTYRVSPSSLKLFLECKRCFYLDVVNGMKRPDGIFPSLPSGMDKILKEHFDRFAKKGELPPEIKGHAHINGCVLFDDLKLLEDWRSKSKGLQYKDPDSGIILRGCVDNIIKKADKLIVLDYKTKGYPVKDTDPKYNQDQMDFYNFLLRKNNYDTEDFAFLLYYYPNKVMRTGEIIFDTKLVKITTDVENASNILKEAIELLQSTHIPPKDKNCRFCSYKEPNIQTKIHNF